LQRTEEEKVLCVKNDFQLLRLSKDNYNTFEDLNWLFTVILELGKTSFCKNRMSALMSWAEKLGFTGRKGMKKAEMEQKVDWSCQSYFSL
jgi:NADH pyrophosphatase NudC (nudix superfamily)